MQRRIADRPARWNAFGVERGMQSGQRLFCDLRADLRPGPHAERRLRRGGKLGGDVPDKRAAEALAHALRIASAGD